MATSVRQICGPFAFRQILCHNSFRSSQIRLFSYRKLKDTNFIFNLNPKCLKSPVQSLGFKGVTVTLLAGTFAYTGFAYSRGRGDSGEHKLFDAPSVIAASGDSDKPIPKFKTARSIKSNTDDTGLKLTVFQYQTCPFCCKLRAYLDYRGFSYDVVEVNSVWRTQTKWSTYKKVPILVMEGIGPDGFIQLNDSSVICSILESLLVDRSQTIENLKSFYPVLESKTKKGKTEYDWPNRYFIMYGENKPDGTPDSRKEERKWRHWTDAVLVHTLSSNIYRTPSEALQAFNWFSQVGEWDKHFSNFERNVVLYVGSLAMYFVGKMLIKKYNLKEDVRESLYDACNEWTKAVGNKRRFMGGDRPCMADLSVYGVLSAIEGCPAFLDVLEKTDIGNWYYIMKKTVSLNEGSYAMSSYRTS